MIQNGIKDLPEFVMPWMQIECTKPYGSQIIVQSNNYRWHAPGEYRFVSSVPSWFDNEKTKKTSYFTKVETINLGKIKSHIFYNSRYQNSKLKIKDLFKTWVNAMRTYSPDSGPEAKRKAEKMAAYDLTSDPKVKRVVFHNDTGNKLIMDVLMAGEIPVVAKYCVFDQCNIFVVMEYNETN